MSKSVNTECLLLHKLKKKNCSYKQNASNKFSQNFTYTKLPLDLWKLNERKRQKTLHFNTGTWDVKYYTDYFKTWKLVLVYTEVYIYGSRISYLTLTFILWWNRRFSAKFCYICFIQLVPSCSCYFHLFFNWCPGFSEMSLFSSSTRVSTFCLGAFSLLSDHNA